MYSSNLIFLFLVRLLSQYENIICKYNLNVRLFSCLLVWCCNSIEAINYIITHFLRVTLPSPSFICMVFERIKFKSVRMLGLRALGVTTPHASLNRRFIDSAFFLVPVTEECGGSGEGAPKTLTTRRWWLGAISSGRLETVNSE